MNGSVSYVTREIRCCHRFFFYGTWAEATRARLSICYALLSISPRDAGAASQLSQGTTQRAWIEREICHTVTFFFFVLSSFSICIIALVSCLHCSRLIGSGGGPLKL